MVRLVSFAALVLLLSSCDKAAHAAQPDALPQTTRMESLWRAPNKERTMPSCSGQRPRGTRIVSDLNLFEFVVPKRVVVKKIADIDYRDYRVAYGPPNRREWMQLMFGPLVSSGPPRKEWLTSSVRFSEQSWSCGKLAGLEMRGVSADSKRSRWTGFFMGFASYEGVSKEAANFFDSIIDSMCCRP